MSPIRELVIERVRKAALFYLGDADITVRAAADRYGVSRGAVHRAVKELRAAGFRRAG